ncbi:hypothetical protein AX15_002395 [Amanita polypyramis BW_CC]|nr:hypothetical protein AX15_002395 [Amanita polypyramis BW_CC]
MELPRAQGSDVAAAELPRDQLANLWESLQRAPKDRPSSRQLLEIAGGIAGVVSTDEKQGGMAVNKYDLLCPRKQCSSVVLKKGIAMWVEKSSMKLEPEDSRHELLPALPEPPETTHWWLVTPSPMTFENIGFSYPVASLSANEPQMKLLACAECDLGPLGWTEAGSTEFWLACGRVAYRD